MAANPTATSDVIEHAMTAVEPEPDPDPDPVVASAVEQQKNNNRGN